MDEDLEDLNEEEDPLPLLLDDLEELDEEELDEEELESEELLEDLLSELLRPSALVSYSVGSALILALSTFLSTLL